MVCSMMVSIFYPPQNCFSEPMFLSQTQDFGSNCIIIIATQNKNITIPFIKSINPWVLDIDWTCVHISSLQYTCGMACGRDQVYQIWRYLHYMHIFMDVWLHVPDIALDCVLLLNQHHQASTTYKIAELVLYRTSEHKATLGYVPCIHAGLWSGFV